MFCKLILYDINALKIPETLKRNFRDNSIAEIFNAKQLN